MGTLKKYGLPAAIAVAAFAAGWLARGQPADAEAATVAASAFVPGSPGQTDAMFEARTKGSPDAPILVYEASDFQCPYCRVFWEETLPLIDQEYIQTGKVRFIFLNLPLEQIHPNALAAHEAAMCAAAQGAFWEVHDLLYEHQASWAGLADPGTYFRGLADSAALDRARFAQCLDDHAMRGLIQQEYDLNVRSGVRSTPSFIIDDHLLPGAAPIHLWRPILDSIFAAKTGGE